MEYRNLGKAGVKVSAIGIGCNQFGRKVDQAGTKAIVQSALDARINFFDTANVYGDPSGASEEALGAALDGLREKVVIATKGRYKMGDGPNDQGASRYHILNAVEASLRRLRTDHIDLYQIHEWDEATSIHEMMRALDDLVRAGKVRYIGASNFDAWQLCRSNDVAEMQGWEQFVTVQPHYHMLEREIERELVPYLLCVGEHRHSALLPAGGRVSHRQIQTRRTCPGGLARREKPVRAKIYDGWQLRQIGQTASLRRLTWTHAS